MSLTRRGWNGVVIAVSLMAVVAALAYRFMAVGAEPPGDPVPDVSVQLLDGEVVSMSQLEGQVVLVNFWATWCPPCRLEMPGFQRVWEARRDDGFTIVGLSTDRLPDQQIAWFLEREGYEYPVGRATRHAATAFGYAGTLPHSFLIDTEGRIRRQVTGAYEMDDLLRDVDALLREAGREPSGTVAEVRYEAPKWSELGEVGHPVGSADAPITVVEFSDYGCTYCRRFAAETYPAVRDEFIEAGRVRWVHVPFVLGKFPNSRGAAVTAYCAAEQGEGVHQAVHATLFDRQPEWRAAGDAAPVFRRYVEDAGGDGDAFSVCYAEDRPAEALARAEAVAASAGVGVTPTFFVNGQRVEGAIALPELRQGLETLLSRRGP